MMLFIRKLQREIFFFKNKKISLLTIYLYRVDRHFVVLFLE